MGNGFWGRILRVDLTGGRISVDEHDEKFYRTYVGGRGIVAHYLLMDPQNISEGKAGPPITVRVKLSGLLSSIVFEPELEVEVDAGSTVADLIGMLTKRFGDAFREAIVDRGGRLHGGIVVMLNGRAVIPGEIAKTAINGASHLTILPLVGGG